MTAPPLTLSPASWITDCHAAGIDDPPRIALAAVGYLGEVLATARSVPDGPGAAFHAAQIALTLAAVSPSAAGWLLEQIAGASACTDCESRAAAAFIAELVETLRTEVRA